MSDVYKYLRLPDPLLVQIVQIYTEFFEGISRFDFIENIFNDILIILRREFGVFSLVNSSDLEPFHEIKQYLLSRSPVERQLSVIELIFRAIDTFAREGISGNTLRSEIDPDDAINELNTRFRENGVGYQYQSGDIIRVDSDILHSEAVIPAFNLLRDPVFKGANEEFLSAHAHYRNGNCKECIVDCAKSFESTMKIICDKRGWPCAAGDTASKLVGTILDNGLVDKFWQTHFSALRNMLSSGIPTPRNKVAAHGQGADISEVPQYLASYILHQTAATILMLVEADKALP